MPRVHACRRACWALEPSHAPLPCCNLHASGFLCLPPRRAATTGCSTRACTGAAPRRRTRCCSCCTATRGGGSAAAWRCPAASSWSAASWASREWRAAWRRCVRNARKAYGGHACAVLRAGGVRRRANAGAGGLPRTSGPALRLAHAPPRLPAVRAVQGGTLRFFSGCCTWGPGELDLQMEQGAWQPAACRWGPRGLGPPAPAADEMHVPMPALSRTPRICEFSPPMHGPALTRLASAPAMSFRAAAPSRSSTPPCWRWACGPRSCACWAASMPTPRASCKPRQLCRIAGPRRPGDAQHDNSTNTVAPPTLASTRAASDVPE